MRSYKNKILILFAHPALQKSRVNSRLITHVRDIEGVTFHDLYEAYPDFHIHVKREQELLIGHDIIIFHHPLFWFSIPSLLKEWMDLVLEHRWAYGKDGNALRDKKLISVITTGGRESLYQKDGFNRHTLNEFLVPIRHTAFVCGIKYLPPFVVHGTLTLTNAQINKHGEDYRMLIEKLRDGMIDFEAARSLQRLNSDIKYILKEKRE